MTWSNRGLSGFAVLTALLISTGCASWIPRLLPGPGNQPSIVCVAHYVQLEPRAWVGFDGCGNVWLLVQTDTTAVEPGMRPDDGHPTVGVECSIISADGKTMIPMPSCPATGDTLSSR